MLWTRLRTAMLCATSMLAFSTGAAAIPSLTPHPHDNPTTVDRNTTWILGPDNVADPDPDNPNGTLHQHRDTDALNGNAKYIGFGVWDNRSYRTGGQYGHGYIEATVAPRYTFAAAFPELGRTDFDAAVVEWEGAVNGNETNSNGIPIVISMHYDRVNSGAHEIDVFWRDIGAANGFALAFWDPGATDFVFDSNPNLLLTRGAGPQLSLTPGNVGCADSIPLPWQWHFGGAGAVPAASANYWECTAANDMRTFNGTAYDFYTIALHELGHSWALDHIGTGIMRADIASFTMRDPDANAIDGLKDHYAIPVSEPGSLVLLLFGLSVLKARRPLR